MVAMQTRPTNEPMNKTSLSLLIAALILVPAQAVFFNHLVLFNVAVPMAFIFIIITLPVTYSANLAMNIGFALGVAVDTLSDTPGVNALACTLLAFARRPLFHLYVPTDNDLAEQRPSLRTMDTASFLKYALTMCVVYCLMIFTIEAFQIFNFWIFLLRIVASSIFTFIIIYALACINGASHEKRL